MQKRGMGRAREEAMRGKHSVTLTENDVDELFASLCISFFSLRILR